MKKSRLDRLTAVVLARNEESHLESCLKTLSWCGLILVLDDQSTDRTAAVARQMGARVVKRALNLDFAGQRNAGLELVETPWVLFVDADERVSRALAQEVARVVKTNHLDGAFLRRWDYFGNRWLRHGEVGRVRLLRLGRVGKGRWVGQVDESWQLTGRLITLKNPLSHYSHPHLTQFLHSVDERSSLNAQMFFQAGVKGRWYDWFKPGLKFLHNYFFSLGFLDGLPGFIYAVMMSVHSFLVRGKLYLLWQRKK